MNRILVPLIALMLVVPVLAHAGSLDDVDEDPATAAGTLSVNAAGETATVVRTAQGVPHVYADTPFALGFGNGYAQAEDQLFQMHVLRHVAKGTAASVLGPDLLASDLEVRREMYTESEREAAYASLGPFERDLFDGYVAGVNRFIAEAAANPSRMPMEFAALGTAPTPWDVTDTLAITQYLLDYFGAAGGGELTNARMLAHLEATLGPEAGRTAFDDVFQVAHPLGTASIPPSEGTFDAPAYTTGWDAIPEAQREATRAAAGATPFGDGESLTRGADARFPFKWGSNAVIVGPGTSTSGGGLLGGGPQMGYYAPMVPYEVGLHGVGFDVAGIGVAGAPGVVVGRTADFSWTVTSGIGDQVDVVGVRLVDGNPRQYRLDGDVRDMDCRTETHVVRAPPPTSEKGLYDLADSDVVTQEACRTVHGPVFAVNEDAGWAFARERSHRGEELESGVRWLTIGMQTDLAGFRERLSDFAFTFNFHYVDDENMAFFHVGYQPVRDARLDPRLPRPGDSEWDWKGVMTGDDLPHTVNPPEGWLVNWNNVPQRGWTGAGDQRELWGPVHRVDLLEERMRAAFAASDGTLDLEDVSRAVREATTRDAFARHTVPHVLDADAPPQDVPAARVADAKAWLAAWKAEDYTWNADADGTYAPGHAIYDAWRTHLQQLLFEDVTGPFTRTMKFDPPTSEDPHGGDHAQHRTKDGLLVDILENRTGLAWCEAAGAASCDALLIQALEAAILELEDAFGTADMAAWRMPEHKIRFIPISASPAWEMPLMNRASFDHRHDWGEPGSPDSVSVMPPGAASGYWPADRFLRAQATGEYHPNARDQLDMYVDWTFKPYRFFEDAVRDGARDEVTLVARP